ncbi:helix-turn-helix domain-containing protein [Lentzea californiensis]|uniref:helix-turn-helix domain-containing protein n=1 Tax=Lentzea californiensis TaxID=438851 RepID=UPI002165B224|nr:helix-turn-helix domain-containing protein [Lentzea californiensis]MCR3752709.1 Helix-turn-helix domain-containing protein [Lentzea californiensis]
MARSDDAQHDLDDLGALLRVHRKKARLTGVEAARRAGFTQSKLSKIENGVLLPSPDDVRRLTTALDMDSVAAAHALELIDRLQDDPAARRIVIRRGALTEHTALLAKFGDADCVVAADPAVVPDWLRTREYLLAATGPLSERNIRAAMALLRKRKRLMATPGLRFEFFVFESALGTHVGSARIMSDQMLELSSVGERHPDVVVRVILGRTTVTPALLHGFEVHGDQQVVLTLMPGIVVITSEDDVQPFRRMVAALRACALSKDASRRRLRHFGLAYRSNALTEKFAS